MVSAEGRKSKIRDAAGISATHVSPQRMVGWKIPNGRLPYPGFGHVFIGGPYPILAYQMAKDEVRIMFELHLEDGLEIPNSLLEAIPRPFRDDVERAIEKQARSTAQIFALQCRHHHDRLGAAAQRVAPVPRTLALFWQIFARRSGKGGSSHDRRYTPFRADQREASRCHLKQGPLACDTV